MTAALPPLPFPVLAAPGFDVVISIAVLAMGVIGWVVQLIQQNRGPAVNRRPPVRPDAAGAGGGGNRAAEEKLRSEIDSFLQDVAGRRAGQPPRQQAKRKGPVDPFEEPPRRQAPKPGRPQPTKPAADVPEFLKPRQTRPAAGDRPAPPPPRPIEIDRPAGPLRDRHLAKMDRKKLARKDLGGDLRKHVERYMAVDQSDLAREHVQVRGKLDATAKELADLKRRIADPNDSTVLGGGAGAMDPDRLRRLLSSPDGVREAIVVNELLSKPLALRPRAVKVDPATAAAIGR